MKKSIELYNNLLLELEEFGEKDINLILKEIENSCYFNEEMIEDILNNKEHKITYGISYGKNTDEWNDDIGENFEDISINFAEKLIDYLNNPKRKIEPYITINFDGYTVFECSYGINWKYKELTNCTWFDLNKNEQNCLLNNIFKIETLYDDENPILKFSGNIEIEVDKKSTEDNIIFLKDLYFV